MCSTYRNRHRVKPRPDISRKPLVSKHAPKAVPEIPQRLRVLQILPVQALKRLDRRQRRPVHRINMPHSNGPHDATDAIPKQTDGNNSQDDRGGVQRHVIEEVLGGKDHYAGRGVGRRRRGDGAHGVLLEGPGPRVDEAEDGDAQGRLALAALLAPSRQVLVSPGEAGGPGLAGEVGDEDDEGARDGDCGGFELRSFMSVDEPRA